VDFEIFEEKKKMKSKKLLFWCNARTQGYDLSKLQISSIQIKLFRLSWLAYYYISWSVTIPNVGTVTITFWRRI
jgi:hypothetical protein